MHGRRVHPYVLCVLFWGGGSNDLSRAWVWFLFFSFLFLFSSSGRFPCEPNVGCLVVLFCPACVYVCLLLLLLLSVVLVS
ncbi:hypothetical protein BDV26DRAFT_99556 [Aspergillus bertholletiae]|uniref:Uncharacterized protein n=1 Tax=Aspergillus bertholletiae TaxID=1226010 RepID=A0A5N7ARG9_9EURO|nr:hypothetical protein BDV26DRAFT_99556 [Aspergillus bertholletiae]